MNEIITTSPGRLIVPEPRHVSVTTRIATIADLPFLDDLQKPHSKQLGFFPRAQMEGYVENGWVLVAEDGATKRPVGYCASRDRYLKRDELGVIYQLCVAPGHQRGLVGATLVREVFSRSAYGCRLYCCWCAQDLPANHFWESLGFVPIAFRGGSGKKKRVHIFWQRRIREGDTVTPWWFPAKTDQGAMREDRLVLPIPPGLHWSDPMPVLQAPVPSTTPARAPKKAKQEIAPPRPRSVQFAPPWAKSAAASEPAPEPRPAVAERTKSDPKPKAKIDPEMVAKARELRDRYLEHVNAGASALLPQGRYDVSKRLATFATGEAAQLPPIAA